MNCKKCGNHLNSNEDFCPNCGNRIQKNNRKFLILGLIIIIVFSIGFLMIKKKNIDYEVNKINQISYHYNNQIPNFIDGNFSNRLINSSNDALLALNDIKDKMGIQDATKEFVLEREEKSENITYYRFKQVYNKISVYNQKIIVSVDQNKKILGMSGYYIPNIDIDITAKLNKEKAEEIAITNLGENAKIVSNELSIFVQDSQKLIYVVNGYSNSKASVILIDANTGDILDEVDLISDISYTGKGMDDIEYTIDLEKFKDVYKDRYHFYDAKRNISITDYRLMGPIVASLSSIVESESIVVDIEDGKIKSQVATEEFLQSAITAMAHFETIYDYYKNVLGRNSYDDKGSKIIVNLGVSSKTFTDHNLNNAMWFKSTNQMFIGDYWGKSFAASLDVLAHEFSHGVISYTANFSKSKVETKANEPGALNEAYADILGSLVENKNWTIAENNTTLRSLRNPERYRTASTKGGKYYYPDGYLEEGMPLEKFLKDHDLEQVSDYDSGGIHNNSTVVSHAAYLMYKNGAFKNKEEMAKVWYNSLFLLSPYSNFEDCALAIIKTARNMELSSESIDKIINAFYETKILDNDILYLMSGTVTSENKPIKDAVIEVYSFDKKLVSRVTTDKDGSYSLKLKSGIYTLNVKKEKFSSNHNVVSVMSDTILDLELKKILSKRNNDSLKCHSNNCHTVKMYYLVNQNSKLDENVMTFEVDDRTIFGSENIVNMANQFLKSKMLSSDSESFYITINNYRAEFSFYYKGTDKKFNLDEPITEDIEIEMKLLNGFIDNDTIIEFGNLFQ